jgi:hypothetical protein
MYFDASALVLPRNVTIGMNSTERSPITDGSRDDHYRTAGDFKKIKIDKWIPSIQTHRTGQASGPVSAPSNLLLAVSASGKFLGYEVFFHSSAAGTNHRKIRVFPG